MKFETKEINMDCVCKKSNRNKTWEGHELILKEEGDYTSLDMVKKIDSELKPRAGTLVLDKIIKSEKYFIRAHGDGHAEIEIFYCPFCSEKLK